MTTAPSTKPYLAVSAADDDDDGDHHHQQQEQQQQDDNNETPSVPYADNKTTNIDHRVIATQTLDLEYTQDQNELDQKSKCMKIRLFFGGCFLIAMAFGGRQYYIRTPSNNGNEDGSSNKLFPTGMIRGSSNDNNNNNELELLDELLYTDDDADAARGEGGMVLNLVDEEEDDYLGGVEEFEGDLDDEIKNGEIDVGEFDSDMEYDGEEEEGEGEGDNEEGEEDVGGGMTFETEGNEYELDVLPSEASLDEEEDLAGNDDGEEEDYPNYFVPLTPDEKEQMKEKLRDTLRATKQALLLSVRGDANGEDWVNPMPQRTLKLSTDVPKQFMHMHHMKTGGTSLDGLISCALSRQRDFHDDRISYNKLSECGSRVRTCMSEMATKLNATLVNNVFYRNDGDGDNGDNGDGISFDPSDLPIDDLNVCKTAEAGVMSYCASLHAVRTFGWHDVDKITVIRNPVDRAWSMYRFQLQRCYDCKELKDVLRSVEAGTFKKQARGHVTKAKKEEEKGKEQPNYMYDPNDECAVQMIGHQATNMLSSVELYNVANDVRFPREKEIATEAVKNLREQFTWVGITDRLEESIASMRTVFPFLAENLNDAAMEIGDILAKSGEDASAVEDALLPNDYEDAKGCPFQHRNAGHDPTCGTKELDDETIALIRKLSARDVAVYEAAVERFELQNEVLEEYRNGSL